MLRIGDAEVAFEAPELEPIEVEIDNTLRLGDAEIVARMGDAEIF